MELACVMLARVQLARAAYSGSEEQPRDSMVGLTTPAVTTGPRSTWIRRWKMTNGTATTSRGAIS